MCRGIMSGLNCLIETLGIAATKHLEVLWIGGMHMQFGNLHCKQNSQWQLFYTDVKEI